MVDSRSALDATHHNEDDRAETLTRRVSCVLCVQWSVSGCSVCFMLSRKQGQSCKYISACVFVLRDVSSSVCVITRRSEHGRGSPKLSQH